MKSAGRRSAWRACGCAGRKPRTSGRAASAVARVARGPAFRSAKVRGEFVGASFAQLDGEGVVLVQLYDSLKPFLLNLTADLSL